MNDLNGHQNWATELLFRYIDALDSGDLDGVSFVLSEAARDSLLQSLILEANEELLAEVDDKPLIPPQRRDWKGDHMAIMKRSLSYKGPKRRKSGIPLTFAAVIAIMILFFGFMISSKPGFLFLRNNNQETDLQNRITIFQRYIDEIWNQGNLEILNEVLTPDHVRHEAGMLDLEGVEATASFIDAFRSAIPDLHLTIEQITDDGDRVWANLSGTGTHSEPLVLLDGTVLPPTDQPIILHAMVIALFEGNLIAETTVVTDTQTLLQQLGAVPASDDYINEQQNLEVARAVIDLIWNVENPDRDTFTALYGDFIDLYSPFLTASVLTTATTREEDLYGVIRRAFPDIHITIQDIAAQGDKVLVHYRANGIFQNAFGLSSVRISPTGEEVAWDGIFIYRMEDHRIVEEWWYMDNELFAAIGFDFPD